MKRKLACFGLAFALSELFAANVPPLVLLPAAAFFGLCLFLCWHRNPWPIFLGGFSGICFFLLYSFLIVAPVQRLAGQQMYCTVVVEDDAAASYQDGYLRGTLKVTQVEGEAADFQVVCDAFPAEEPGESFSASFLFLELEEDSYRASYESSGTYLRAEYLGSYLAQPDSTEIRFALYRLRCKLSAILQHWMPSEEGELEAAMLLGHKEGLRTSIQEAFRKAGVSHLLAVSGLHVALLCGIFSMGRRRRFIKPLIFFRALLVLFYMLLTGLPISVLRAGTVFLLALVGDFFWQPVDLLTSTGVAAFLLGLQNAYAPCDVGFQLSFCAVVGVQAAEALSKWENMHIPEGKENVSSWLRGILLYGLKSIQAALFASLATLPVLVAHNLTTSGVSLMTNLLVVWMLQPALLLGLFTLFAEITPFLAPVSRMASFLLSVWLHWMLLIVEWCAGLPMAQMVLPAKYTLTVFFVLMLLAFVFWRLKHFGWYFPAVTICIVWAILLGNWAQKDVVRIAMVGASNNPCVVCMQNKQALVLFRGGQSNLNALEQYLSDCSITGTVSVVDLRQNPSELDFTGFVTNRVESLPRYSTQTVLDGLSLDLYHDSSGNLAVLSVQNRHIAAMTGNIQLPEPVAVDVFCAAGALSESVQARTILTCSATAAWLENVDRERLLYSPEIPVVVIRPGRSMTFEEVKPLALQ